MGEVQVSHQWIWGLNTLNRRFDDYREELHVSVHLGIVGSGEDAEEKSIERIDGQSA